MQPSAPTATSASPAATATNAPAAPPASPQGLFPAPTAPDASPQSATAPRSDQQQLQDIQNGAFSQAFKPTTAAPVDMNPIAGPSFTFATPNDPTYQAPDVSSFATQGSTAFGTPWTTYNYGGIANAFNAADTNLQAAQATEKKGLYDQYAGAIKGFGNVADIEAKKGAQEGVPIYQQQLQKLNYLLGNLDTDITQQVQGTDFNQGQRDKLYATNEKSLNTQLGIIGQDENAAQANVQKFMTNYMNQENMQLKPIESYIGGLQASFASALGEADKANQNVWKGFEDNTKQQVEQFTQEGAKRANDIAKADLALRQKQANLDAANLAWQQRQAGLQRQAGAGGNPWDAPAPMDLKPADNVPGWLNTAGLDTKHFIQSIPGNWNNALSTGLGAIGAASNPVTGLLPEAGNIWNDVRNWKW